MQIVFVAVELPLKLFSVRSLNVFYLFWCLIEVAHKPVTLSQWMPITYRPATLHVVLSQTVKYCLDHSYSSNTYEYPQFSAENAFTESRIFLCQTWLQQKISILTFKCQIYINSTKTTNRMMKLRNVIVFKFWIATKLLTLHHTMKDSLGKTFRNYRTISTKDSVAALHWKQTYTCRLE